MLMARVPDGVRSRSFTLVREPLSLSERIALECLKQIALEARVANRDEIQAGIGSRNECGSTATGIINRLVDKGYVEHVMGVPIQRGLWLRIVETGQQTSEPRCTAPHWRYRKDAVPSPTIQRVAEHGKPLADMIEAKAKSLGKSLADFLMDCVYVGFHEICRDEQQ
jgi:hypothetical protein